MTTITDLIPSAVLDRFLQEQMTCKLVVVAVSGSHAYGYPNACSPLELKGLHIEPTENLVGLKHPPKAYNWVGEFEGYRIDFSSKELGPGLKRLLKGDGSILERILAPRQMVKGDDLQYLQNITRGIICRRFFNYYRYFSRGVLREYEGNEHRTVRHLLGSYRLALTGVHLLRTGEIVVDLMTLAKNYGFSQISDLIKIHQESDSALLMEDKHWINQLVNLHSLLESALEESKLPIDPENPGALEDYLLDMRRSFFDACTAQRR